jgi:hypothetical protein
MNFPISRWRLMFDELRDQLLEIDNVYGMKTATTISSSISSNIGVTSTTTSTAATSSKESKTKNKTTFGIDNEAEREAKRLALLKHSASLEATFDVEFIEKEYKV